MNAIKVCLTTELRPSSGCVPAEPLWKRAPTRDDLGRPLSDFMMLIPSLSKRPDREIRNTLRTIEQVLLAYGNAVVFADMNLKLNTLWVTVRPIPGICLELPAAIKTQVPEALLVAQKQD
ncbi:MAG: hypothetical protein U9R74_04285 [Pseudomonadota bacterium]|nr:hypothetical protein [Pseudomonadota bacterium]